MDANEPSFWREVLALAIAFVAKDFIFKTYKIMKQPFMGHLPKGDSMKLEKEWDFKALAESCKNDGLEVTEDAARMFFLKAMDFVDQSVTLSANPYDDILKLGIPQAKNFVLPMIDKIDGKEG